MKKTYSTPATIMVELSHRSPLMDVSYQDGGNSLGSMGYDTSDANAGGQQMTKGSSDVWSNEW